MNVKNNKKMIFGIIFFIILVIILIIFSQKNENGTLFFSKQTLNILSGSENEVLEPILEEFEKENNIKINMTYEGSVDIMQKLQKGATEYDAVFTVNSIRISMPDSKFKVKHQT